MMHIHKYLGTLMDTFSATDASETSSSSASWTSLSESDGDKFQKSSFLGELLEISPLSSIEQISRRRIDASCIYVENDDSLSSSGGGNDNLPPTMARYDDLDFPSEDERRTEGEKKANYERKTEDERKKRKHPGIRENITASNSFLKVHRYLRLEIKDKGMEDMFDAKDYERYLIANSASPNAIQASLLYCIQNDDVDLVDTLLRDVGIEYLLRHCYLMTMHELEDNSTYDVNENSLKSNNNVQETNINIYWLACYYGSAQVLDIIAQDTLAYFLENDTDHVSIVFDNTFNEQVDTCGMEIEFGNALSRAKDTLTNLLEKPVTELQNTPLYTASERDNGDVICVLLKYGANPNTPNKYGNTPALIASSLNNVQALQALDKSDIVDWNKENEKGMVPVLAASQCGNLEALRVLSKGIGRVGSSSVDFKVRTRFEQPFCV